MGHSQADKAQSRESILRKAADAVRDTGLESVSVGKLMRSVDLTHGGFYNHFASALRAAGAGAGAGAGGRRQDGHRQHEAR